MRIALPLLAAAGAVALSSLVAPAAAERTVLVPPARMDVTTTDARSTAVLAGGCFWGMEAVFSHVKGVQSVTAGYAGGDARTANYGAVSTEGTAHAEAVRIAYDPRVVSYATLLRVYFSVAHDPTEVDRQGPDSGRSYRSAIFPQSPAQERVARQYIGLLDGAKSWGRPLATRIEHGRFFTAEAEHQNFAQRHPDHPYIREWDAPKLAALQRTFPQLWRAAPAA